MGKIHYTLLIFMLLAISIYSQNPTLLTSDSSFKPSGKPIIQVFGNFDYNATRNAQKTYGFWFGRAHFGYQYHFSKHLLGKVIIDAGRPTTVGTLTVTNAIGDSLNVTSTSKEGSYYTMTLKFA